MKQTHIVSRKLNHYTRSITLECVTSDGAFLWRISASFKAETSQLWRVVGDSADLTRLGITPKTFRTKGDVFEPQRRPAGIL